MEYLKNVTLFNNLSYNIIHRGMVWWWTHPDKAYSGDVLFAAAYPFDPGNDDLPGFLISCSAPWGRFADQTEIPIGASGQIFYTAKETIFSPYGNWRCRTCKLTEPNCGVVPGQPTRPPAVALTAFSLRKGMGDPSGSLLHLTAWSVRQPLAGRPAAKRWPPNPPSGMTITINGASAIPGVSVEQGGTLFSLRLRKTQKRGIAEKRLL